MDILVCVREIVNGLSWIVCYYYRKLLIYEITKKTAALKRRFFKLYNDYYAVTGSMFLSLIAFWIFGRSKPRTTSPAMSVTGTP